MPAVIAIVLPSVCLAATPPAPLRAADPPHAVKLASIDTVLDYRTVFEACENAAHDKRLALRTMTVSGRPMTLLADPASLATQIAPTDAWTCAATTDDAQANTRLETTLNRTATAAMPPNRDVAGQQGLMRNEGLMHGAGDGAFVTGDLCPSTKPLDRGFLAALATAEPGTPVALSISGLWLLHHADDFAWIREENRGGALRVTWVNHSFHHPFDPARGIADNFLVRHGIDFEAEVLDTERLLIAQGETPSLFFRFPGLVANTALMARLRALHLVALGADAWLTLSPLPRPGAIVLVHPNGNEPSGLRLFARDLATGKLPKPFRALIDAP